MKIFKNDGSIFEDGCYIKLYEMRNSTFKIPVEAHAHEYVQLWYVLGGYCLHEILGEKSKVEAGELFIVPPLVEHEVVIGGADCAIIGCDFPLEIITGDNVVAGGTHLQGANGFDKFVQRLLAVNAKYSLTPSASARVESDFKNMLVVYEKRGDFCLVELKGYLLRLLSLVLSDGGCAEDGGLIKFEEVRRYITERLKEKVYLSEVAAFAGMSVSSFNNFIKKYSGKSYVEYFNFLRVETAKALLTETNLDVCSVGKSVGFDDAAYFNRIFKKHAGTSPGQYRASS